MTRSQYLLAVTFALCGAAFIGGVWAGVSLLWAVSIVGLISIIAYLNVRLARLMGKRFWELRDLANSLSAELEVVRKSSARSLDFLTKLDKTVSRLSKEVVHQQEAASASARLVEALLVEQAAILRQQDRKLSVGTDAALVLESQLESLITGGEVLAQDLALLASETKNRGSAVDQIADVGKQVLEKCNGISGSLPQVLATLGELRQHLPAEQRMKRNFERALAESAMETVQSVEALMQLRGAYDFSFGPLLGGWAMDPVSLHGVLKVVRSKAQPSVVELGSGTSTIWLAKALAKMGGGRLVSVEHQLAFAEDVRALLVTEQLGDWATVFHAPLQHVKIGGREFNWYSIKDVELPEIIDVLLVDGPPGAVGDKARYPALPLLKARLASGSVVILDDTHRKDEAETLASWADIDGLSLSEPESIGPRTTLFTVLAVGAQG